MQDEEKVYYPEVIQTNPFPGGEGEFSENYIVTTKDVNGEKIVTQQKYKPKGFPKRLIAHETIGQALNTKSRKILSDFELIDQGALRVGRHQPGVSGELSLTPAGIMALNQAGITTFAIDGETGDVTFLGEMQGGSININNQFEVDNEGNVIARSIALVETEFTSSTGVTQTIDTTSYEELTGSSRTLTLTNPTIVFYIADIQYAIEQDPAAVGDYSARGIVRFRRAKTGGSTVEVGSMIGEGERVGSDKNGLTKRSTNSAHWLEILQPGEYTISLVSKLEATTNAGVMRIFDANFTLLTLGRALA